MPFDDVPMSTLGGAGATPASGSTSGPTVLRGPVDKSGAQSGGNGPTNFRNG